ncbi:hypothetical protein [Halocatena marina]|uniref:Uncharacterized protein n=1 Tax=Halocatena marina TaxID=2934937 RepID=A0ABD5YLP2_9EURY|nr:hypothetical protein [Halocatena marina]
MRLNLRWTVVALALVYGLFAVSSFLSPMPRYAVMMNLVIFFVFGSLIAIIGITHEPRQEMKKVVIAFSLIYGLYALGGYLAAMPQHALQIGLIVYFVFGIAVLTVGVSHGQYRASRSHV